MKKSPFLAQYVSDQFGPENRLPLKFNFLTQIDLTHIKRETTTSSFLTSGWLGLSYYNANLSSGLHSIELN